MSSNAAATAAAKAPARKRVRNASTRTAGGAAASAGSASKKPSQFAEKLAKAITRVGKAEEEFTKSVDGLREMRETSLDELAGLLAVKEQELEYLEQEFENQKRQQRLQVEYDIREYGLEKCTEILAAQRKIPVEKEVYEGLQSRYDALQASYEDSVRQAVADADQRNESHCRALERTLELQKQAEVATVEAKFMAQQTQIEMYKETVNRLSSDNEAQRQLTKDVAASASKGSNSGFYPSGNGSNK
jgi:hypothetical protein